MVTERNMLSKVAESSDLLMDSWTCGGGVEGNETNYEFARAGSNFDVYSRRHFVTNKKIT